MKAERILTTNEMKKKTEHVYSTDLDNTPDSKGFTRFNLLLVPSLILSGAVGTFIIAYFLRDYNDNFGIRIFEYTVVITLTFCGFWLACRSFIYWVHKTLWK